MALRPAGRARLRVRPRTLRGRLTLVFALVTFGLAVLVGILVDVEYRSSLKSALDAGLRTRFAAIAQEVTAVPAGSKTIKPAIPDAESFAQVIDAQNHVLAAAPPALNARSVLNGKELATALDHRATLVRDAGPRHEASRLLAGPSGTAAQPVVVVVGSTLEETNSAQHSGARARHRPADPRGPAHRRRLVPRRRRARARAVDDRGGRQHLGARGTPSLASACGARRGR